MPGVAFPFTAAVGLGGLAAAYFRAGQSDALEEAYGNYFEATGEIGRLQALKGERAIDGAAFLDTVLEKEPVDMDAFAAASGALRYATTRSDNGDGVFWPLERVGEAKHLRQFLRAGLVVPGAGEPVQLVERSYYDGSIAEPLPVQAALDAGCDRVVVIRTHPSDFTMPRQRLTPALALALNAVPMTRNAYLLSHLHYNRELKLLGQLQRDGARLSLRLSSKAPTCIATASAALQPANFTAKGCVSAAKPWQNWCSFLRRMRDEQG